jgi:hypothetical protein
MGFSYNTLPFHSPVGFWRYYLHIRLTSIVDMVQCHWNTDPMLWLLVHHTQYMLSHGTHLSLQDYMDFLRRARWKLYQREARPRPTGHYLEVLDWEV